MKILLTVRTKVLIISLIISSALLLIGGLTGDIGVIGNMIIISTFVIFGPQFFFLYEKQRALKEMEERFPTFLRDVTENVRAGSPLYKAIMSCKNIDYGILSKEVKKISNQLSWGIPLDRVLDQFAERVKGSKRLNMTIQTIRETYLSGGDVASTLEAMADNLTILREAEKEKSSILSQYVLLMYVISIMFVGIVIAINKFMVPIFESAPAGIEVIGLTNPCEVARTTFTISLCSFYNSISTIFLPKEKVGGIISYYIPLFFMMSMIESFFAGLIAGVISEDSILSGLKHSIILCLITFGSFGIMVRAGFLGG